MKRFHVHLNVEDLDAGIAFYTRLFGAEPARVETDYAKWMLEDPRLNFAISARGAKPGLDHLGFQADTAEELDAMKTSARQADMAMLDEGETTCCYARSDKHWIVDPTGVPWEHFHTLGSIPVFNEAAPAGSTACCEPAPDAAASARCEPEATPEAGAQPATCCAPAIEAPVEAAACCAPAPRGKALSIPVRAAGSSSCC